MCPVSDTQGRTPRPISSAAVIAALAGLAVGTVCSLVVQVIVSNPPFHAHGREGRPDIGRAFIGAAAAALKPGGALWLVANRHLPYEDVLDARFGEVSEVASSGAFKVIHAVRARTAPARAGA